MKKDTHPKKYMVTVFIGGKPKYTVYSKFDKSINLSAGIESHNAWSDKIEINTSHDDHLKRLVGIYSFEK